MYFYDTLGPLQLKHEFTIVVVGPPKSGGGGGFLKLVENIQWIPPPPE